MAAKEDLEKKIQSLEDQLSEARESLANILISELDIKVGDVVMRYRDKFTVSSIRMSHGSPTPWGKKTLKNGSLGNQEFEIYGTYTKV